MRERNFAKTNIIKTHLKNFVLNISLRNPIYLSIIYIKIAENAIDIIDRAIIKWIIVKDKNF